MMLLPVLTGLLLAITFPRADQGYLAWVAFIPLIVFVNRTESIARAFCGGFVSGAVELLILLAWTPTVLAHYGEISFPLSWILFVLMVAMLSVFSGASCALNVFLIRHGGKRALLLFPLIWVILEYIQSYFPFGGFPWLLAGYSQTRYLSLIQIADLTGVYGVSFLVLWLNTGLVWAGVRRNGAADKYWPLISGSLLIICCLLYGRIALERWSGIKPDFSVAMLQGNISVDDADRVIINKLRQGYLHMADGLKLPNPDLLLIPESPTPVTYQHDMQYRHVLETLSRRYSMGLIFNSIHYESIREDGRYFNSAYFLDKTGALLGRYDKIHLVPFGEYIPLKKLFFFAETITRDVGDFHTGRSPLTVKTGSHPISAIICFEAVFPDLVRRFVDKDSQLIVNLTNDRWYGDSSAPYQHLAIARWRAVENRRYFLRAANSGISAVIEPTGRMQTSTGLLQEAVCTGYFSFLDQKTVYTRCGDVFVLLCAIITLGLGIGFLVKHKP
jgi:apolipoprotein N-acyltransferase